MLQLLKLECFYEQYYYTKILILKIMERRELHMALITHKILHGYMPIRILTV
jgi:hypothetical protein